MNEGFSVERRLGRIEARAEIGDLVARYALGADRKNDPAIMGPLFAHDGVWVCEGFAELKGREAIRLGLAAIAAERVLWSIHYMGSPLIALADDDAHGTCQWYLWELCTMETPAGPEDQWLGGWYDGTVVLTEEGWKFSKVVLDIRVQGTATPPFSLKKPAP